MPQTLDRFRSSTWGWMRGTLAGWGTLMLVPIGIVGLVVTGKLLPLGFVAVAAIIALVKWFQNLATTFEVTEDRLILHRGVFNKSIDEIELYRIKDIRIDFSLINQMAGVGTITLMSSDETTRAPEGARPDQPRPPRPRRARIRHGAGSDHALTGVAAGNREGQRAFS